MDKSIVFKKDFVSPKTGETIDMIKIRDRIDFVRGSVYNVNACFGALLDNLNFIYTFDVPTQATDGTRLFINPEWTNKLSDGEIRFVLIHELMHCVFDHMNRSKGHSMMLSNVAADFEANGACFIDNFVTKWQMEHLGSYFSDKYASYGDLWSYEMIYKDLLDSGFIPNAPELDIIWPKTEKPKGDPKIEHTTDEWKRGHSDAIHECNKTLNDEYSKITKKVGERYKPDEIKRALENSIIRIKPLHGNYPDNPFRMNHIPEYEKFIKPEFITYEQGWDSAIAESMKSILYVIGLIDKQGASGGLSGMNSDGSFPATDPAEEALNIPRPPMPNVIVVLSKEDVISQQEGANMAREAGYSGEFIKEEQLNDIAQKWKEQVQQQAGKEGSSLLTRHLLETQASGYNWTYELRKMMNNSLNNSKKYTTEWGEKRGLARDTMTLRHKNSRNSVKDIVFLVDCSGSVSDKTLSHILSECYSISKKCNVKNITYAYFTTKVELVETNSRRITNSVKETALMKLKEDRKARGGHITGGTDFMNALKWVDEVGGARCVIVVTDGYDTPVSKPSYVDNLIWCIYDNKNFKAADSSRVVYIDTSKMK